MELHAKAPPGARLQIKCRDCGHAYSVSASQRSSRCEVCGNIEFHGETGASTFKAAASFSRETSNITPAASPENFTGSLAEARKGAAQPAGGNHFALSPEILKSFAQAHPQAAASVETFEIPKAAEPEVLLGRFRKTPDGLAVQEIIERYQVEWQLWAVLVKNFADPSYHAAYLAQITGEQNFEEASARYRDHRAVMLLSESTRWEAEVAELMISRVETLATLRLEQQVSTGFRVPAWLWLLPVQSRPFRIAWITLGMLSVAKIFGYI